MVSIVLDMIRRFMTWLYGIKPDKWLHAVVALVTVEVLFLASFRGTGKPMGLLVSAAVTLTACGAKEVFDMISKGGVASWGDVIAGIAGTVIGGMVMTVS